MTQRWKAILASIVTMGVVTIVGVLFVFRPLSETDTMPEAWSPLIGLSVYLVLSVLLLDWAARRTRNSYTAAFVIASAQFIFIVDLYFRRERGILTTVAGTVLLAITCGCVAFVHSQLTKHRLN